MFQTVRLKEMSQTAMVTGSKPINGDNKNNIRLEAFQKQKEGIYDNQN
jgi:hypothetical protein